MTNQRKYDKTKKEKHVGEWETRRKKNYVLIRYVEERIIHQRKDDTFEKKYTSKGKRRSEGKITHCRKKNTPKKGWYAREIMTCSKK